MSYTNPSHTTDYNNTNNNLNNDLNNNMQNNNLHNDLNNNNLHNNNLHNDLNNNNLHNNNLHNDLNNNNLHNNNLHNDLNNNNLHNNNNNNFNTYDTSTTTVTKTEPSLMDKTKEKLIVVKDATKVKAHQLGEKIDNAMHQHKNCKNKHEHHPGGAHTKTTVSDTHTQHHNVAGGTTTHDQYTQENRSFGNDGHKTVDTTIQHHEHQEYPEKKGFAEKLAEKVRGTDTAGTAHHIYPKDTTGVGMTAVDDATGLHHQPGGQFAHPLGYDAKRVVHTEQHVVAPDSANRVQGQAH